MAKATFCPVCQRKNRTNISRCIYCGAPLTSNKPDSSTTESINKIPPDALREHFPCQEYLQDLPKNALALLFTDEPEPVIIEKHQKFYLGRGGKDLQESIIDLTQFGGAQLGVSRRHVQITFSHGTFMLEDLFSTNGTWLNQNRLTPGQSYPLQSGDEIWLGRLKIIACFNPSGR